MNEITPNQISGKWQGPTSSKNTQFYRRIYTIQPTMETYLAYRCVTEPRPSDSGKYNHTFVKVKEITKSVVLARTSVKIWNPGAHIQKNQQSISS